MRKLTNEYNGQNLDTSETEVFQETPVIQDKPSHKPSHNSQTEISQTKRKSQSLNYPVYLLFHQNFFIVRFISLDLMLKGNLYLNIIFRKLDIT